jgi:bacterioferritin (cytochrome b1)
MKDNYELVAALHHLLSNELEDIREDLVLSEMCASAGFEKSHQVIKQQALRKIRRAGWLMQHIISLNGQLERPQIDPIEFNIGDRTKRLPFRVDRKLESAKPHELGLPLFAIPNTNEHQSSFV